jgi:hypothetical protein
MAAFTNAKQSIPLLFKFIMDNHRAREALPKDGTMTQQQWREQRALVTEMKSLRRDAEKALRWNTDKGNTND